MPHLKVRNMPRRQQRAVMARINQQPTKGFNLKLVPKSTSLPIQTVTIVPSTTDKDKPISKKEFDKRVDDTRKFLSENFGGFTDVRSTGGFVLKSGKLVKEPVVEVTSFSTQQNFKDNKQKWLNFVSRKRKQWKQESVSIIIENDLKIVK